jgi:uncharacterized membrane protein YfcA
LVADGSPGRRRDGRVVAMDPTPLGLLALAAAAMAAGVVNAVAGGGTLISFPALTAIGIPPVAANITNTVALSPGYLGGTLAQRKDLAGQRARLVRLVPVAVLGGLSGGVLLLVLPESVFRRLVPFLILLACALLAGQDRIRGWVERREAGRAEAGREGHHSGLGPFAVLAVFAASLYGGYFGAGVGIILLAVLGSVIDDSLTRINALKQSMAITINGTAAIFFLFSGMVVWWAAAVMAVGSLIGGSVGGRLATRLNPVVFRRIVIVVGVIVAVVYLVR